ncbi:MAG: EAL domain-containing protein [Terracidiphilus sp.]
MKRTLKQRVVLAIAITLAAAACGLFFGYLIGRRITLNLAAVKLGQSALQAISDSMALSHDAHAALDAMNASSSSICSDEDLIAIRGLVYRSHFLKEAGRIRDGKIACSSTLGRDHLPETALPPPNFIGADGVRVYRNPAAFSLNGAPVTALRAGDSYVILNPFFNILRGHAAAHLKTTVIGPAQSQSAHPEDPVTHLTWDRLTSESDFRIGDFLYATRCSYGYNTCMTASLSVSEALAADPLRFYGCIAFGAATGIWLGLLIAVAYSRSRSMDHQLRRAIRRGEVTVVYQPIVKVLSGEIVGAEALARWTDEEEIEVGPSIFIKLAEERGFVGEITRLVVRRALKDFAEILHDNPDFRLSINVAAADLSDPGFLPMLDEALKSFGVGAKSIVLEITESSTARHEVAIETILRLRERGHSVHIDDFGTGYSSLSYLHDLSVDAIKIDQTFTRAIGTEAVTLAILPQIIALAQALHLQVIVEGIETSLQASYFSALQPPVLGQGWFFGYPVAVGDFARLLAAGKIAALAEAV